MATKHKRKAAPKIVVKPRRAKKIAKPNAVLPVMPAEFASTPTMPNGGAPPSFPHNH